MQDLTITKDEYLKLRDKIAQYADAAHHYLLALVKIHDSRGYLYDCPSWKEWCAKFAGRSEAVVRQYHYRQRKLEAKRLIQQTTGEKIIEEPKPKRGASPALSNPGAGSQENLSTPEPPKPEPAPKILKPYTEPGHEQSDAFTSIAEIVKGLEKLAVRGDVPYEVNQSIRHLLTQAKHCQNLLQPVLFPAPPPSLPSLEMAKLHAAKIGLPETEAERFWNFYNSKGWKVGNQPMKSWHSAMANWKLGFQERSENARLGSAPRSVPSRNEGTFNARSTSVYGHVGRVG